MNETGNTNENSIQQPSNDVNDKETENNRPEHLWKPGYCPNPNGRPKQTEEDKIKKKAIKEIIKKYEASLAEILPDLPAILKKKAIDDEDIQAIREIHDRVMGKPRQNIGIDGGEDNKPIAILTNAIHSNHSNQENSEYDKENQSDSGGNISQQDSINSPILNTLSAE